ncbi:MAG: hypothetical protein DRR08_29245 [Candidatus Parabeggiatoa sp. nov. 2]|nr:MAG: hypothetical protein DRR08_29245 [Gammaproteobacteria bacterium]
MGRYLNRVAINAIIADFAIGYVASSLTQSQVEALDQFVLEGAAKQRGVVIAMLGVVGWRAVSWMIR